MASSRPSQANISKEAPMKSASQSLFSSESKSICTNEDLNTILHNLRGLKISETYIKVILNKVKVMPNQAMVTGALKFLTELQHPKSMREEYYSQSKYFSEYFCTLSNLGLFAVGCYYQDSATLFAATFSALSHAIPSERLHDLDLVGVGAVFLRVLKGYQLLLARPDLLLTGAGALAINGLDTLVAKYSLDKLGSERHTLYLKKIAPVLHSIWHVAVSYALFKFLQALHKDPAKEIDTVSLALMALSKEISPALRSCYDLISNEISKLTTESKCVIL